MELRPIRKPQLLRYQPGDRAGCFTVIRALGSKHFGRGVAVIFAVRCDCGNETERDRQTLVKVPVNCEACRFPGSFPPGWSSHAQYPRWQGIISRCTNPNSDDWKNYGGRGIAVHADWLTGRDGLTGLETFVRDMGDCPEGHSIERVDNSRGYEPGNCIWAERLMQSRNRRGLRLVSWKGETLSVAEWAERTGIPYFTLMRRVKLGWSAERALTEPLRK